MSVLNYSNYKRIKQKTVVNQKYGFRYKKIYMVFRNYLPNLQKIVLWVKIRKQSSYKLRSNIPLLTSKQPFHSLNNLCLKMVKPIKFKFIIQLIIIKLETKKSTGFNNKFKNGPFTYMWLNKKQTLLPFLYNILTSTLLNSNYNYNDNYHEENLKNVVEFT